MATKLNTEFNYRYQVQGETPWERIKTLKGFLVGRKRAAVLEEVGRIKHQSKIEELKYLESNDGLTHDILNLRAEIMELESHVDDAKEAYELNRQEIEILERLLAELYANAEPTRISGYTDEQMFEANAVNEYTTWLAKEIHAEIIATGHPSPAHLRNAMSCPQTFMALQGIGLIPKEAPLIICSVDPLEMKLTMEAPHESLPA